MNDFADDTLLDRIGRAFDDLGPVPEHLSGAARSAFAWRRADAALAELLVDSADDDELVGVRSTDAPRRSFKFGVDETVIRVHVTGDSLVVMVEPPTAVDCRVATPGSVADHRTDELGELVVPAPELPVRIEVDLPGGTVHTPWITA